MAFAVLVSGCVGDQKTKTEATGDGSNSSGDANAIASTGEPQGTETSVDPTSTGTGGPNAAPTAVPVATPVEGADYTFLFDGSNSTDPEEGALTYAWDFGDNSSSANASETHAYDAEGLSGDVVFNVTLTVTDPGGLTAATTISVNFTVASGPPPGTFLRDEVKAFSGTITLAVQDPLGLVACGSGASASVTVPWAIAETESDGTPLRISKFVLKVNSQGQTGLDIDYYLYDPANVQIGRSAHYEPLDGPEPGFTAEGSWAPGTYTIKILGCTAANAAFSGQVTATHVAA